nr:diguanylate cyclase [Planosporangium flavigriseum]
MRQLEVLGEMGRGAQAIVYRVRRGGSQYAMKVLQPAGVDDEASALAFRREAALLASINDPGLARVHEVGVFDGRPYLLMDLIEGQRLSGLLSKEPLPADRVTALGIDLAAALGAAHRAGLVHRDVKPDNIILTPDGSARLIDFGLAARMEPARSDGSRSEEIAGTLAYSSPEQAGMLNRPVDGRSDLYSLGAVLFECATGEPPFSAADVGELLRLHAVAQVPDPRELAPELPPALAAIIVRLLAKDPDDRYQSGTGLLADLRRVAADPDADFPLGTADEAWSAQDAPMVGMDDELATLTSRWERALGNRGGVVLVHGAPGGGKSRLVRELAGAASRSGHLVLHGKASADDPQPFAPLRAAVDTYVRSLSRLPEHEAHSVVERLKAAAGPSGSLVKNLSPALAEVLTAPDPTGEVGQERYAAAVAAFLTELARLVGGAVLRLDDVQWCDEATIRVLEQMAPELGGVPMLVVGTARDDAASVPAVETFRSRLGDHLDTRIVLKPLAAPAVGALVGALSGGLTISDEAATRLAARSAGNPFTLMEYVKAIIDSGLAQPCWGTWRIDLAGLDDLELPETAAELVLKRVDALDVSSRRLLGVAAGVGSTFDPDLVADVCEADRQRVLDMVADAAWHRLVEPRADGRYAFLHDRIREALLGQFDEPSRRRLHDRIADILARRVDPDPETAYALAHHRALGEPDHAPAGTFHACYAAGRLAMADHAPESALFFLEHAVEAAVRAGIALDTVFGQLLGTAYHQAARLDDAVNTLQRALDSTREPMERARILHRMTQVHESAWHSEAQAATAEQGLAELGYALPRNPGRLVASTLWLFVLGCLIGLTGIGRGTAGPRKRERYTLAASLYEIAAVAHVRELQPTRSLPLIVRGLYLVNRVGPSPQYAVIMSRLPFLVRAVGLHRIADKLAGAAARTARELGDPGLSAFVAFMDAVSLHGSGKDSGERTHRMLEEHSRWLDFGLFLDAYAVLDWDWLLRGDMAEMEAGFNRRRARAVAGGQAERSGVVATDACLLALRGRAGEAAAHLAKLIDDDAPLHQQVDVLIATFQAALEQNDFGDMFDDAVAKFAALGLKPLDLLPAQHTIYVYQAYGHLERCRNTDGAERTARLAEARKAVAVLRKVTHRPIVAAHYRVTEAALYELAGEHAKALAKLAAAEPVLRAIEAPLVAFEAALVRARCLRALGAAGETLRQAGYALSVAKEQGWPHRARWVSAEFGLANAGSVVHHRSTSVMGSRHSQRWAALEQVSLAASRVLDPAKLARIALDETIRILGAERAFLLLLDGESSRLVPHVGRDASGNDLDELTGYSASLIEKVHHEREALVVTGTEEGEALGSQSMLAYGLRSILIAPLLLDGRLLGVVYLDSRVAKGVFTPDDVDILTAVTHHVAVAMETARAAQLEVAVEAANRQRDLAETLRDAMTWLSATLDPNIVLRRLLTTVMRARDGERAWLLLGDAESPAVTVLDGSVLDGSVLGGSVLGGSADDSPAVVAAQPDLAGLLGIKEPSVYGVDGVDGAWPRALAEVLVGSVGSVGSDRPGCWLVVPLIAREQRLGVLVLAADRTDAYGDADIGIATALVSQGMVAYENARLFTQVHELATVDSLTGIANRRHFFDLAGRAVAVTLARRVHAPVAAVMLDIDHFKRINDTYGHQVGDDVIRGVVARLRSQSRETDLLARYGGEEFVLLLSDAGDRAAETAERLRASVAAAPIETRDGPVDVTISVGVAYLRPEDSGLDTLLGHADECLYRAKESGRNRVVVRD